MEFVPPQLHCAVVSLYMTIESNDITVFATVQHKQNSNRRMKSVPGSRPLPNICLYRFRGREKCSS
jgi:hypothetical protein